MANLIFKWLKSENCSSEQSKKLATLTRQALNMTHKQYRKLLSWGRAKEKVLEKTMSEGNWNDIDFSKIPSKAGMKYRNAFAVKEVTAARYAEFMKSKETKVNASVLNPVDIAHQAFYCNSSLNSAERVALQKYWDSLPNYYAGREENGIAVVDVSGSMSGLPMEAAVSLGAYVAEKGHGPFANHFITFSEYPRLCKFEGVDIVDKFQRCRRADWGFNTNIEAVFDLLLDTARSKNVSREDIPTRLYIFSDMQFDAALGLDEDETETLMEGIAKKWAKYGYELPELVFWNLRATDMAIPAIDGRCSYISGFSPVMISAVLEGKTGWDLCLDKLLSARYEDITAGD